MGLTNEPWVAWTAALIIGVPLAVIGLAELHLRLQRSGNALAGPVNRLRIWLLPLAALLILLTQAGGLDRDNDGVQVVATLVGTIAVGVALSSLNAALFGNARSGTWRDRLPSIFVDLGRLVLVVTGAAVVASLVWGLDVGGWFAALGVGSIVIGLALQNAVGSVVSGLLLLFEQPFRIGDTLDVGGVTGRVVEMNWRSTHVDTGTGIQIIPNATIAGASFSNLTRPTPAHDLVVETSFAASDDPDEVARCLLRTAVALPILRADGVPAVQALGAGVYATRLPLETAADAPEATSMLLTWVWYAARRAGLTLDGVEPRAASTEEVSRALDVLAGLVPVSAADREDLLTTTTVHTYGAGETVVAAGTVPAGLGVIVAGRVRLMVRQEDGALLPLGDVGPGDVVAESVVNRDPALVTAQALTVVDVLELAPEALDRLVMSNRDVAVRLGVLVRSRTAEAAQALDAQRETAPTPLRRTEGAGDVHAR